MHARFDTFDYPDDIRRMVAVVAQHGERPISAEEAQEAWDAYSNSFCAGWMALPDSDDDLFDSLKGRIDGI